MSNPRTSLARQRFNERRNEIPDHVLMRAVVFADLAIVFVVVAGVAGWL